MDFVVTQEASGREKEPNEAGRKKQDKERLDLLLLRHALAESREKAKALIMAGWSAWMWDHRLEGLPIACCKTVRQRFLQLTLGRTS